MTVYSPKLALISFLFTFLMFPFLSGGKNTTFLTDTSYQIKKVVIDAGHGGKDSGCLGKKSQEKHIALRIALLLGKKIKSRYPHIDIVYTRDKDVFIPLDERANIANKHRADLFISVHCNFIPAHSSFSGSETYVLGLHKSKENFEVAKRENAAIFLEDDYKKRYKGYDFSSPETDILLSAVQSSYMERSALMAGLVEKRLRRDAGRKSHGVKQAGFLVLRETTMPSILVETGFLSNRAEEDFLASEEGQESEAQAIFDAFTEYKNTVENGKSYEVNTYTAPRPVEVKMPKTEPIIEPNDSPIVVNVEPKKAKKGALAEKSKPAIVTALPVEKIVAKGVSSLVFKVQIIKTNKKVTLFDAKWKAVKELEVVEAAAEYIYRADGFTTYEAAAEVCAKLKEAGFKDAFVLAFEGKNKINLQDAIKKSRP
jgi:N-acetylmuramoyl-L-alanine amidase